MDAYHLALFVHICAVLAAAAAASLSMFSGGRYARAANHDDARAWLSFNGKAARVFPIVLIVLLVTGGYMASLGSGTFATGGWIQTGVGTVGIMFAIGAFLGVRHKAVARALDAMTDAQKQARPFRPPRDRFLAVLPQVNTFLALAMVLVMATKPTLAVSAAIAAGAGVLGAANGFRMIAKAKAGASTVAASRVPTVGD